MNNPLNKIIDANPLLFPANCYYLEIINHPILDEATCLYRGFIHIEQYNTFHYDTYPQVCSIKLKLS